MDFYLFTLGLSFGALLLMAVLGLSHHHVPGKTLPAHGPAPGHHHGPAGQVSHQTPHGPGAGGNGSRPGPGAMFLALVSPRTIFGLLLGFGATGLILRPLLANTPGLLLALAVVGGWGFERLVMGPVWKFLLGFASRPARTLDSITFEEGHAVTDFDARGHGLIAVQLDGQVRQVLGQLPSDEFGPDTPRVRTGDRLFIREVDHRRNTCTVSRLAC